MTVEQHFKEAKRLLGFLRDMNVSTEKDVAAGDLLIDQIIQHFRTIDEMNCEEAHEFGRIEGIDSVL